MKEVLMYIVNSLVDEPGEVKLDSFEEGEAIRFKLKLSSSDKPKIIGREGRVIKSIRTLLQTIGNRNKKRVFIDIE